MEIDERVYKKLRHVIEGTSDKYKVIDKIIQELKDGKIKEFGEPDFGDMSDAYFPQKFLEIVDEKEGIVKVCEEGTVGKPIKEICVLNTMVIYNEEE